MTEEQDTHPILIMKPHMNFYIDIECLTSVSIHTEYRTAQREDESAEDFLIRKLKEGSVSGSSYSTDDHPEFKTLRTTLGATGFIKIEETYWNGDVVVKPFYLNNVKFKKGDRFFCAAAMRYTIDHGNP